MARFGIIVAIAVGGALGALARYGIGRVAHHHQTATGLPIGTFIANLVGCLLIGFLSVYLEQRGGAALREGVRVGFLGALTTFSTYSYESILLMQKGQHGLAAGYVIGSVVVGLTAAVGGIALGKAVFPA